MWLKYEYIMVDIDCYLNKRHGVKRDRPLSNWMVTKKADI